MAIRPYLQDGTKYYEVYLNGFDSGGRRVQRKKRGIETLKKAQNVEFEFKRKLAHLKEQKASFKFGEWFDVCIKRMKAEFKPSTIYTYETMVRKWVHPHWLEMHLSEITRTEVHELVFEKCAAIKTPSNRQCLFKMVKRILEMAVEDGALDRNPTLGIRVKAPETEQKVLTNTEAEILLREAKINNHRFYPIWVMALMTGMRSGELYALRWTDLDFDGRTISVSRQWTSSNGYGPTKTQRSRIVPISDDLLSFLKPLKLQRGAEESVLPRFIEWQNGEQARITREFCEAIGITVIKFHDLRATFITNLLARGESLARVMSIVGHSQLKTTNGYLRKAGVEVQGGTDKLGYKLPQETGAQILSLLNK